MLDAGLILQLTMWGLIAGLLVMGIGELIILLYPIARHLSGDVSDADLSSQPPMYRIVALIAASSAVASACLLLYGRWRRHLHLAVICIWIWLPARIGLLFCWHLAALWFQNIRIYDQTDWLKLIGSAIAVAAVSSLLLLWQMPMRKRFPKPAEDIAGIF